MPSLSESHTDSLLAEASFVRRLARALVRDSATADDVSQDVMTAALQQPSRPRNWRHWLSSVTRQFATKRHNADRRRSRHEANAANRQLGDPEQETQRRLQLHRELTDAVLTLPEPYRTVVTLRFFYGLPPRTIAQRTSSGSDVVRQRLRRGLVMLREKLDCHYGSRPAWLAAFSPLVPVGFTPLPFLTIPMLAMNKLIVAATATIVGGAIWVVVWPTWTDALSTPIAESHRAMPAPSTADPSAQPTAPFRKAAATTTPECFVTVRDATGQPVPDAIVFCWKANDRFLEGATDHLGTVRFAAAGAGGLLARADGLEPTSRTLEECRGKHTLVLTECAEAAGVLWIDGQPAPEGTKLRPYGNGTHSLTGLPNELQEQTKWTAPKTIATGRNGTFRLDGLPPDWQGGVRLPYQLWLLPESGGTQRSHERLSLDLGKCPIVHTTMLPTLRLQLVWEDTVQPVEGADVMVYGTFVGDESIPIMSIGDGDDGRFVSGLHTGRSDDYLHWCNASKRPLVDSVRVSAQAPGSDGRKSVAFSGDQVRQGLITMRLPRASTSHFIAVDATGQAIAGAMVLASSISEPTDTNGHGRFYGRPSDVKQVGAKDYRIGPTNPRAGTGTEADPLVFELEAGNAVTIELLGSNDALPVVRSVLARGPTALFAGRRMMSKLDKAIYGVELGGQQHGSREYRATLKLPKGGTKLALHSLEPGIEATITVVDAFFDNVTSESFTTPPPGETHAITLRVATKPYEIAGRVVDENGDGIKRARIELQSIDVVGKRKVQPSGSVAVAHAYSDDDGRFRVRPVYGPKSLRMSVKADGYVTMSRVLGDAIHIEPIDVRLMHGCSVTVRVVDEHDQPLSMRPHAKVPSQQERLGNGVTRFDDLPAGEVAFYVRIGGVEFRVKHDTKKPGLKLRVPRPGMLRLKAAIAWPQSQKGVNVVAIVSRLDVPQPQYRIWRPDRDDEKPHPLLPGRYRCELVEQHGYNEATTDVPLGLAAQVTVLADKTTTATLR